MTVCLYDRIWLLRLNLWPYLDQICILGQNVRSRNCFEKVLKTNPILVKYKTPKSVFNLKNGFNHKICIHNTFITTTFWSRNNSISFVFIESLKLGVHNGLLDEILE